MKNIDNIYITAYFRLYYFLLLFSKMKFQIGLDIYHIAFLQCSRIKSDSPILINAEKSTSSFRQSLQICCGEEEREQEVGDDLSVCVLNLLS